MICYNYILILLLIYVIQLLLSDPITYYASSNLPYVIGYCRHNRLLLMPSVPENCYTRLALIVTLTHSDPGVII